MSIKFNLEGIDNAEVTFRNTAGDVVFQESRTSQKFLRLY